MRTANLPVEGPKATVDVLLEGPEVLPMSADLLLVVANGLLQLVHLLHQACFTCMLWYV